MADVTQEHTQEELERIQELLSPLESEDLEQIFSPMIGQYRSDLREVRPESLDAELAEQPEGARPLSEAPGPDLSGLENLFGGGDESPAPADDSSAAGGFEFGDFGTDAGAANDASDASGAVAGGDDAGFDFDPTSLVDDAGGETPAGLDEGDADFGAQPAGDADTDFNFDAPETPAADDEFRFDESPAADLGDAATPDADAGADFDFGDLGGDATPAADDLPAGDFDLPGDSAAGSDFDTEFSLTDEAALPAATDSADAAGGDFDLDTLGGDEFGGAGQSDVSGFDAGGGFESGGGDFGFDNTGDAGLDTDFSAAPAATDTGAGDFDLGGDLGGDFGSDAGGDAGGTGGLDLDTTPASSDASEFDLSFDDLSPGDAGAAASSASRADSGFDDMSFDLEPPSGGGDEFGLGGDVAAAPMDLGVDASDLADMSAQAQLDSGIGNEFTDEDLARIRTALVDYPPGIKKTVIDVVVNEKISQPDQRLLINMIIDQAEAEQIADFLEARLGYRPDSAPSQVTKEGVQIIYTDEISPESMARRRARNRFILLAAGAALAGVFALFGGYYFYHYFSVQGAYQRGLDELIAAQNAPGDAERLAHRARAEELYASALAAAGGKHDPEWQSRYGIAHMRAGFFDDAFEKLYGRVEPDYGSERPESAWSWPERRAPLVRLADGASWPSPDAFAAGERTVLTDRDEVQRKVAAPGAYLVDRLRDQRLNRTTLISLARFHSNHARNFVDGEAGRKYKNDELAIDYYRLILTLMNQPDDMDALSGIGDIYYQRGDYAAAAREYHAIVEKFPNEVRGHASLLNTFLQIWKQTGDPRPTLAKHREIRQLGLEEDLPIYITSKLAAFYIGLDPDQVRIRYQVDPVDSLSGLDLDDNAQHLLALVFQKEETRDGVEIVGSRYGEGFYQRGRYLMARKEGLQALKQFQNSHNYDPRHYLAVNAMGEYYRSAQDFDRAGDYFLKAIEIRRDWEKTAGNRPEDETLIDGDLGRIYYNLGSLLFLRYAGFDGKAGVGYPDSPLYPDRARREPDSPELKKRREQLASAREYFDEALRLNLRDENARTHLNYWMGWIDYVNSDFESALVAWDKIDPLYSNTEPALLMGRGNSYYYTDQTRSALGAYLKVRADLEKALADIEEPDPQNAEQRRIFRSLAAVYNNIGAVYEREYIELYRRGGAPQDLRRLEENALLFYEAAIETARKVSQDNEIARVNSRLAFKYSRSAQGLRFREPAIDDQVAPLLESLKDDL